MFEHTCELSLKPEHRIPFVIIKPLTIKNVWKTWCSISKYTPKCNHYMNSISTLTAERRRHTDLRLWWIIHPFSYARFLWDMLMTGTYMIAFFTIPFMICFVVMDYRLIRLDKVNLPVYAMCWLDILLNCITGYYDKQNTYIELKPTKIFKSYLKGYLVLDVLSSFPYDHITLPWRKFPGNNPHHVITLINILPLIKLTRYCTVKSNIYFLFKHFKIYNFYYNLCITLALGLYLIVWFSCLCYLIPILTIHFTNTPISECKNCWMARLEDQNLALRFQNAVFIVLESISASGHGLFVPETDDHIILICSFKIIGKLLVSYMLIIFIQTRTENKASDTKFYEIIDQVKAYTSQKQLLPNMKKRLLAYYHYRFKNSYFHEKRILSSLSKPLREEIALQSCRRLIENVTIFKNLPRNILQSIVKNLKYELYLPNDVIVVAGSQGDCMYFLSSGTVAILTPTGKEVCHLHDGAHFGEVALLVADQRRVANVIAIEVCEVYRLNRKDFRHCIAVHSELFAKIELIATERVKRTMRMEEQDKHFTMRPVTRNHI